MPNARHDVVKRILPASTGSSAFAVYTDDQESSASSSDDSSTSSQTSEARDTRLDDFQNELFEFIQNLQVPSTSDLSVSTVDHAVVVC